MKINHQNLQPFQVNVQAKLTVIDCTDAISKQAKLSELKGTDHYLSVSKSEGLQGAGGKCVGNGNILSLIAVVVTRVHAFIKTVH